MLSGRNENGINYYTARKLKDMSQSLEQLAKAFDDGAGETGSLTKDDGLAAMQTCATLVCGSCGGCSLYEDSEKEDSYYLYYLLRIFEQNGHISAEDMPELFKKDCRRKRDYLEQLNRSFARAAMNLSWKNRFLESRDVVISQFRELAVILDEFSRQIGGAKNNTEEYKGAIKKEFRRYHILADSMLLLEYDNGRREIYLTAKTTNGRCVTSKDAAELMGEVFPDTAWLPAKDSRSIITRKFETVRFEEKGDYYLTWGAAGVPKQGERYSGDNYSFCERGSSQVMFSLCDGMGFGAEASRESRRIVELLETLLETGFAPRSAFKLVNTVLLLAGGEQHPAALDAGCIDLYTGALEIFKLGAPGAFVMGQEGIQVLEGRQVPAGALEQAEPVLLSRKLWDGDRLIMVTDGVLDALPGDDKEQVMGQFLDSLEEMPPQDMAEHVLDFALSFVPGARDDMTVLAVQVWKK